MPAPDDKALTFSVGAFLYFHCIKKKKNSPKSINFELFSLAQKEGFELFLMPDYEILIAVNRCKQKPNKANK